MDETENEPSNISLSGKCFTNNKLFESLESDHHKSLK